MIKAKHLREVVIAGVITIGFANVLFAQDLPKPKLGFVRVSEHVNDWGQWKMYEVEVENRGKFDNELFVPSPALPPCGRNSNASRTWLNIYNGNGTCIYGWCAINANGQLSSLKLIPSANPQALFIVDPLEPRVRRSEMITIN